ncbi:MAG: omega-6 fatty acid desaturase (delta-12 desaturase) [Crocinitomicaceae bacterium]|jgi:omega-6 fatty acid desaturase (delta-12 desaturase)
MNSDKTLLSETISFAKEKRNLSWFHTLSTLALVVGSLSLTLLNIHWGFKLLASVFSGLVLVRMFVIYHDFLHEAILKRSKIANVLFTIFGYYMLTPKTIWKRSHNYHHTNNSKLFRSGIGSYPVYTKSRFEKLSSKDQSLYLFVRHPLVILFGYFFTFLYGMCIQSLVKSFRKHLDSLVALLFHFTLHTSIFLFFGWEAIIWFSLIPHVISGGLGAYLFYAQHNFPDVQYQVDQNWTYEGAALDASSFLNTSQFMNWVSANIGHHHIHHLNARIPFYRLPEIMRNVDALKNPKMTTLKVQDIIACLRLKVWDTELNKMVSVSKF